MLRKKSYVCVTLYSPGQSFPAQMVEGANVCELLISPESLNVAAACQFHVCSDVVCYERRNQGAGPAQGD